ncbi:hypothetical protein ACHAXT_011448 [Thalassiosira profunda]
MATAIATSRGDVGVDGDKVPTPKASNSTPKRNPQTKPRPPPPTASATAYTASTLHTPADTARKHEDFKNQLVHDVFGRDNKGKVPMEKVAMLIWQFRDDPAVVKFMSQFVAKFSGSRSVFDGIEFYLPQIAHMIIHLEADWDEAILERFALVIAQQSQHFALQLTWILQGAIEDYQPETVEGRPNPGYNQLFYSRCITLLSNIERCVVYGSPRSIELQRMYEKGDISREEYEQMKLEDRLNNAQNITTHGANFRRMITRPIKDARRSVAELRGLKTPTKGAKGAKNVAADAEATHTSVVQSSTDHKTGKQISTYGGYLLYKRRVRTACYKRKNWKMRYFEIEERMLYCYNHRPSIGGRLVRAMPLEGAVVREKKGKYPYMFEAQNQHFEFIMRAKDDNEMQLWIKLLKGESEANALIPHIMSDDEVKVEEKKEEKQGDSPTKGHATLGANKLTPSQQARYDFFKNERDFVADVCDVAEVLRFHEPKERKALAPGLVSAVKLPPCAYVPLCKSTDVWRRVDTAIANDTRVFNTNERCPMIYYFVSKRGEKIGTTLGPKNPNFDVAEYLHMQFQVPDSDPVGRLTAIGEDAEVQADDSKEEEEEKVEEEKEGGDDAKEEDGSDDDTLGLEDPTDSGRGTVWSEENASKFSSFLGSMSSKSTDSKKGNDQLRKFMSENVVKLPSKLALQINRIDSRRKMSYLSSKATPGGMTTTPIIDKTMMENPIMEVQEDGSDSDVDSMSLGGQSIVSVDGSSIIMGDQVVAFQQSDGVDKASLDRAKQVVCGGESWAEKSARMLRTVKTAGGEQEDTSVYEIVTFMAKSNDDLRQEVFVMQMIHYFESVFAKSNIPLWLKTYRILSTGKSTGLIEVLTDATSIDGLKKAEQYPETGGMRAYFEQVYGPPTSKSFLAAQRNFVRSLAGYSLVSYLLGLKDRHNGNIMIDTRGHIVHIDFGFAFGMAPGHEWSLERAPFKLTRDYLDVMGGTESECFKEFQKLFVDGFKAARSNSLTALGLVEIMMYKSNYPCFTGTRYGGGVSLKRFEKRLMLDVPDRKVEKKAMQLIASSIDSPGTKIYDVFQYHSNGLAV